MKFVNIGALTTFSQLWPNTWHKIFIGRVYFGFQFHRTCFIKVCLHELENHQVADKVLHIMLYKRQRGWGRDWGPDQTFIDLQEMTNFYQWWSTYPTFQTLPKYYLKLDGKCSTHGPDRVGIHFIFKLYQWAKTKITWVS